MNSYEPLWLETDRGLLCRDCGTWCWQGTPMLTPCDRDGCCCERCERARRALELDDRDDTTLAGIARDMEAEARPELGVLVAERFGKPTRGRA
jgi:hypothetical protein